MSNVHDIHLDPAFETARVYINGIPLFTITGAIPADRSVQIQLPIGFRVNVQHPDADPSGEFGATLNVTVEPRGAPGDIEAAVTIGIGPQFNHLRAFETPDGTLRVERSPDNKLAAWQRSP
jgi:hypothetical protein